MMDVLFRLLKHYFFRHRLTLKEMVRYGMVGGTAAGIDFFLYLGLIFSSEFWRTHFLSAHAVSFFVANIFAFSFHKWWTFRERKHPFRTQYLRYFSVTVSIFFASDLMLYLFSEIFGLDIVAVKLVLVILASVTSYAVNKLWTFNKHWYLET